MTHRRKRMPRFGLLMAAGMLLAYASAGADIAAGSEPVATDDAAPALTVADRIGPDTRVVPGSESSDPVRHDAEPEEVAAAPSSRADDVAAARDSYPVRIQIPAIEVDAAVVALGLNQDGTLEVPTDFDVTGWYTGRSVPGDIGPSVVVGHVDSHTGPAVFFELSQLEVGDLIQIERSDQLVARFQILELTLVDKDEFPTQQVYGDTSEPTLRLITCGGDFDRSAGSYEGNLIVFAEHVGNSLAATSPENASLPRRT